VHTLRIRPLTALLLVLLADAPAHAQARNLATPEAAATAFTMALRSQQYAEAAAIMHPEALARFRAMFLPLATHEKGVELRQQLFGASTVADLNALDDVALFERFLRSVMTLSPEFQAMMGAAETDMIGHVAEGTNIAHVVYRMRLKAEGIAVTKLDVMSLQLTGGEWKALLNGDIEGMAEAIRRQIES
jgi:hypothetical protein